MKKIFLALFLLFCGVAYGQTPQGFTKINSRYVYLAMASDSGILVPRYAGVPSGVRGGMPNWAGQIAVDTANHRLYFYSGGSWRYSTAGTGGGGWSLSLNSITAGTDKIGTSNNARMNFYTNNVNTMTLDSVGARLYLLGGLNPLLSLKQLTSNQEWQMRVGIGTGIASSALNIYDATASKIRMILNGNNVGIGNITTIPSVSQLYVFGGATGGNIDARGDSTVADEANIEAEHSSYDGGARTGYGLAMRVWGNVGVGTTAFGYLKKNMSLLDFTNENNLIRVLTNNSLRFGTNNTERMVLDSNGRFGIGTSSPTAAKLHVVDNDGSVAIPTAIISSHESTDTALSVRHVNSKRFDFLSDGALNMFDMSSAPSTPTSGYGKLYSRGDTLRYKNDAGTEFTMGTGGGITGSGTTNYLPKWTGASALGNSLIYDNGTNVGIGTTSPVSKFEVPGSQTNSSGKFGSFELQTYAVNNAWLGENTYYNGGFIYRANGYTELLYFINGEIQLRGSASGTAGGAVIQTVSFKSNYGGTVAMGGNLSVSNGDYTGATLVATSSAVGIGTTSPSAKLHITAGTASANTAPLKFTTGTSLTTAEAGAFEYTTPQLFFTNGGAIRQEIPQIQQARVSTQYDNTTTTLGTVTGLTTNVAAGKTYRFEAVLYTTSNGSGGVKFAMAGTATATNIIYEAVVLNGATVSAQTRATALATTVGAVTAVTNAYCKITGTITVTAAGTFLVQAAANAAVGTTSVLVGSTFVITEML